MMKHPIHITLPLKVVLSVLVLLVWAQPSSAILGVRRRTAVVAYSAGEQAGAEKSQQAAQQQQQSLATVDAELATRFKDEPTTGTVKKETKP